MGIPPEAAGPMRIMIDELENAPAVLPPAETTPNKRGYSIIFADVPIAPSPTQEGLLVLVPAY